MFAATRPIRIFGLLDQQWQRKAVAFQAVRQANEQGADGQPARSDQPDPSISRKAIIARNQNTYAKRQREMDKKAKAEAKRARRSKLKEGADASNPPEMSDIEPVTPDEPN